MAQAVSRQPLAAEPRFRAMWHLWYTKWHWERIFSQQFCFLLSVPFYQCSTFIYILILLFTRRTNGREAWEPSKNAKLLRMMGTTGQRVLVFKVLSKPLPAIRSQLFLSTSRSAESIHPPPTSVHSLSFHGIQTHPSNEQHLTLHEWVGSLERLSILS